MSDEESVKKTSWISNLNNVITLVGALTAAVAAIVSNLNKGAIERVEGDVKKLGLREQREKASLDFANTFLEKILADEQLKTSPKHTQALLCILNIVAQASASDSGESSAQARGLMPLQLALLLNQPGGLAVMDSDYKSLNQWIAMALADDSTAVRVTAIQALSGICQKALREGRLEVVSDGVDAVDQLLALIPEDQAGPRATAIAARSQFASFLKKQGRLLEKAVTPDGSSETAAKLRVKLSSAFPDATVAAQEARSTLRGDYDRIVASSDHKDAKEIQDLKSGLANLDAALKAASQLTLEDADVGVGANGVPHTKSNSAQSALDRLIKSLSDGNLTVREGASSDLALLGQTAVKPLVDLLAALNASKSETAVPAKMAVARAFSLMRQPIELDEVDAYYVVDLVRSPDQRTRSRMVEFLMNLESDSSVSNCFDIMERFFFEACETPKGSEGTLVLNLVTILGTWARNLQADTLSRESGKTFPTFALENSREWLSTLERSSHKSDWRQTVSTLKELIGRAEQHKQQR